MAENASHSQEIEAGEESGIAEPDQDQERSKEPTTERDQKAEHTQHAADNDSISNTTNDSTSNTTNGTTTTTTTTTNAALQAQLSALQSDKNKLEAQYRSLLGKLSSMRDTLGSKLQEDAEELDRREAQIAELQTGLNVEQERASTAERQLREEEDRSAGLASEVGVLRSRISSADRTAQEAAEAGAHESASLHRRLREMEAHLDRTKAEKEHWQALADEEHFRAEQAEEAGSEAHLLLDSRTKELDAAGVKLADCSAAQRNVEGLLSEAQMANQKEFDEMKHHYEAQIRGLMEKSEDDARQAADAKASLEIFRQDAERTPGLEQESKEKTLLIGKVRHEAVILNEHLTEALKRLKEYNTSDSVDRQLISNILLQFVTTPRSDGKRFEMLTLLGSILNWNQYEREQAGIVRGGSGRYNNPSLPSSPSSSYLNSAFRSPANHDNASFGQLFVEFLLNEAGDAHEETEKEEKDIGKLGLLRHYVVQLLGGKGKKQEVKGIREQRALMRSAMLRKNGGVLTPTAFFKRKQFLIEAFKQGSYLKQAPPKEGEQQHPPNPLNDPEQMDSMMDGMKKQMVMFIPQTVIMGWINSFFSGFILIKLPFPLTRGFKSEGNHADGVRDMQTAAQLAGTSSQPNPMQNQDMNKVFKAEIDNLELYKVGQVEQVEQPSEPLQPEQAYTHTQLQQHTQQPPKPRRNLRKTKEEDSGGIDKFELPKSTVTKLAKEGVPDGAKFQKDTLLAIQKSSSVFINWLASSAQEKAHDKKNKTINAENVFAAVKEMELGGELDELLNDELAAYREIQSTGRKKDNEQEEQDVQDTNEFDPSVIEE
ncbi:hypothetical protein E3P92_01281 [Wallemia ichthyophaga]|nr:hypothetical protein E3P91_00989 [Wallemia ichthyophaga]TIA82966.1 hypothetical protein E3P98_01054 [Wallemia ichthyophaga]TIA96969.1 hypothetical protein E3P95_03028 [Wallemia ichthyophaga]TIA98247.1 hypothetical protein E3P94_03014 [Wallemia ichthyophaga]TIB16811.1 hypothetical protein E3P92_01281 [Wallemia ichthyophaga]